MQRNKGGIPIFLVNKADVGNNYYMDGGKNIDALSGAKAKKPEIPVGASENNEAPGTLISWTSKNLVPAEKGVAWYIVASLILMSILGWLLVQKDWLPVVVIIIVIATLSLYLKSIKAGDSSHNVNTMGINSGNQFYPFSRIHSYWIVYDSKISILYIVFLKKYLPSLVINLGDTDPQKVREVLSSFIPEQEKRGENLADRLIRIIGL